MLRQFELSAMRALKNLIYQGNDVPRAGKLNDRKKPIKRTIASHRCAERYASSDLWSVERYDFRSTGSGSDRTDRSRVGQSLRRKSRPGQAGVSERRRAGSRLRRAPD